MIRDEQRGSNFVDDVYQALQSQKGRTFAITAPAQNSGVAKCAAQIGQRFGEAGARVLLVDFNLVQPKLHIEFGVEQREWWPGDPASIEAIRDVGGNLSVLSAPDIGGAHIAFHERLTLNLALQEWKQAYDYVFLCCPPSRDDDPDQMPSEVLCSLSDGTVILAKGGVTTVPDIQSITVQLERAGANIVGAILNDTENVPVIFDLVERLDRYDDVAPRLIKLTKTLLRKSLILNAYR